MKIILMLLFFAFTSCEILEEDISDKQVQLLAPADGIIAASGAIDFHWRALQFATEYQLTLATPSLSQAMRIVADTVIYADSLDRGYRFQTELAEGDYEWSVTAFNSAYTSQSQVRKLRVEAASDPETPENPKNTSQP